MGAIQSADGNDSRSATDAFDSLDLRGLDVSAVRALADAWGLRKLNFGLEHSAVESAIEEQLTLCSGASPSSSSPTSSSPPLAAELVARFDPQGSGLVDALEMVSAGACCAGQRRCHRWQRLAANASCQGSCAL